MSRFINSILATMLVLAVACDHGDKRLAIALNLAGDNRGQLELVLSHYEGDDQKREAAQWLIANMIGHSCTWSQGIQDFADSVMERKLPKEEANHLWDSLQRTSSSPQIRHDIETIDAAYLIDNIDGAFNVWQHCQWRDEVDFERFKLYVLPYRANNELLRIGWRDSLIATYGPIVADAKTAKEAFEKLRYAINSSGRSHNYDFGYTMDAVALRNHYSGVCMDRCILVANACRALGIPVTIDNSGKWANYSNATHSWVSLVLADGTYTIIDSDSVARCDNPIDASTFCLKQPMPADYPYTAEFRKRAIKVWRHAYELVAIENKPVFNGDWSNRLSHPHQHDVSPEYGICASVTIDVPDGVEHAWLCTHALEKGWIPQAYAKAQRGKVRFENIADSAMMIAMASVGNEIRCLGVPFYLSRGNRVDVRPDATRLISITLSRKYPINANWLNRYCQIPGTRLEGSSNSRFEWSDTLYTISRIPVYHNASDIHANKAYRYIRLIADYPSHANMERVTLYDDNGEIIPYEPMERQRHYDLGTPRKIARVEYFPWNDGNFVEPGHNYELVYWDNDHWRTLGHRYSDGYSLTYDNIPTGALLLLHDHTEGREERPFTIQDNRQIWW